MQPSKRWVWTPATELSAYPLWAGTTSASGTPPTTGTTGVSSACSRRAARGGRSSPRRSGWPSCWNLRRLGSRPPRRSRRRAGRPTLPAPALADPHRLRFWSTDLLPKTKNLQTRHLSFCLKPTITGLVNITWCNMMLWNSTNSIQVRWYREGESQLLDSVMVLGATKDEPTSSVLTLVPQRTTDGAVYRWRCPPWRSTRWWWSVTSGNLKFKKKSKFKWRCRCTVWNRALSQRQKLEARASLSVNCEYFLSLLDV